MIAIISFFFTGFIFGLLAIVSAFLWSWKLFGDIWHQNILSGMWYLPIIVIFLVNILSVWLSQRFFVGFKIHWWYYALATIGFLVSGIVFILYFKYR